MINPGIRWFVFFSVAVHTAALTAWQQHKAVAGNTAQALQLSVINHTAGATAQTGTDIQTGATAAEPAPAPARQQPARQLREPVKPHTVAHTAMTTRTTPATPTAEGSPAPPAQATIAASDPVPDRQESERQLRTSVRELVAQQLKYPAIARRKGWQGTVYLELHIEADGRISRLRIDKTSGYAALDHAAADALQLASLPHATQWLNGQAVDLVIPVEYRLLDS